MIVCVAPNPSIDRLFEVEALSPGRIHRPLALTAVAGGKGLNVARAVRTLGGEVLAVTLLAGHAGRWIADELARAGVPLDAQWGPGETRSSYSIADRRTGRLTEFYERGPAIGREDWRAFEEAVAKALGVGGATVMTVSGSMPVGAPPDGHAQLVRLAAGADIAVVLDAGGEALAKALPVGPIVKVNETEARAALGRPRGRAAALAAELVERGAAAAVVTSGAAGAYLLDRGGTSGWLELPSPGAGRYPVGSGDAFMAGLALGLDRGTSLLDAARLGMGAGGANALIPGPGELDPAEAERLADQVTLRSRQRGRVRDTGPAPP